MDRARRIYGVGTRSRQGLMMLGLCAALQASGALAQSAPAAPAAAAAAANSPATGVFVPNAPDRHTVVRGDTLWGIAGKYLQKPWQWPQIWQMNKEQVRNPHLIYPGQVIVLNKADGTMSIAPQASTPPAADTTVEVRLRPGIRAEATSAAIAAIPAEAIEPFLSRPVVIEPESGLRAPRVVGSHERVLTGSGDEIYVSGVTDLSINNYVLVRPGRELRDPDDGSVLGQEAVYLGTALVTRRADPLTLRITSSEREVTAGDRLLPEANRVPNNYVPRAPEKDISGRIVAIYSGIAQAGRNQIVAINRGSAAGVESGHVFALQNLGRTVNDRTNGSPQEIKLPDERNGLMFVFRVYEKVSYALILSVTNPVSVGDRFIRP